MVGSISVPTGMTTYHQCRLNDFELLTVVPETPSSPETSRSCWYASELRVAGLCSPSICSTRWTVVVAAKGVGLRSLGICCGIKLLDPSHVISSRASSCQVSLEFQFLTIVIPLLCRSSTSFHESAPEAGMNAVACESCRARKCKCDRLLPACSQCNTLKADCSYPEQNKRGFPEGYMSGLEQRLIETEIALLSSLSGSPLPSQTVYRYSKASLSASKAQRMEEWKKLPLATTSDSHKWHSAKMTELQPRPAIITAQSLIDGQDSKYF
jgi:hypothetical protein